MKRAISVLLIMVLILSVHMTVSANELSNIPAQSDSGKKLFQYMQGDDQELLILRKNYGYMTFIEDFRSNVLSLYLLEMTDKLIDTGDKPDKDKYMEILTNIIATYDLDCADDIAKQHNMDNLKSLKDYAMDFAKMGAKAVSVMVGNNPEVSKLETMISTAINGLDVLIDNTDNWIVALSNLETIIQDYSEHDKFLRLIIDKSDGELKAAAQTLHKGLEKALEIKLDTYRDISDKNYKNYEEFFFSDVFFNVVKQMPEYETDEALKYFVDVGDTIVSKVGTWGSSWELGKMIGTLVGDVVVGGENLINRVLEMMAIYDISVVLQGEIIEKGNEFLTNLGTDSEGSLIDTYVAFSQYLIGCRIRGEYCLYSIVAKDAGLLSWFNKKSAEEAKIWYEEKVERILEIQNNLLKVCKEDLSFNDIFSSFPQNFTFTSGVGAWDTQISINEDGTFLGGHRDSNFDEIYISNFTGIFSDLEKIDEYTYKLQLKSIELENTPGEIYYKDDIKYIYCDPYGLADGKDFILYLPGRDTKDLPDEFLGWVKIAGDISERLPFYGLYNVNEKYGFFSDIIFDTKPNNNLSRENPIEVSEYLDSNPEELIELFDMQINTPWQFGDAAESYHYDDFAVEWKKNTDYTMTSAGLGLNTEADDGRIYNVSLYGIILGMTGEEVKNKLTSNGYIPVGSDNYPSRDFYAKNENGKRYGIYMQFYENQLSSWYWCNWREGEDLPNIDPYTYEIYGNPLFEFIQDGGYLEYTKDWSLPVKKYCLFDLNQDGTEELIIASEDDGSGFSYYQVYAMQNAKIVMIKDFTACYGITYSEKYHSIVFSDTRPSEASQSRLFETYDGTKMVDIFYIQEDLNTDTWEQAYTKVEGNVINTLTEDEYMQYLTETTDITEWLEF